MAIEYDACEVAESVWAAAFDNAEHVGYQDWYTNNYLADDRLKIAINVTEGGGAAGGAYPWVG